LGLPESKMGQKSEEKERGKMKGKIFDVKRYAIHDGPGIRTTVFFQGCPLSCAWCHNPEGMIEDLEEGVGGSEIRTVTTEEVMEEVERGRPFFRRSGGGVTFSGGEPLGQPTFLRELLEECRRRELHTALDTSGYVSRDLFASLLELVDLFLFDLKLFDPQEHERYTGVSNEVIFDNLRLLAGRGKDYVLRFPVIPDITDREENLDHLSQFVGRLAGAKKMTLLPFHDVTKKYELLGRDYPLSGKTVPSDRDLAEIARRFERQGVEVEVH